MLTTQRDEEIGTNSMRKAHVDLPELNTQLVWAAHLVSWRKQSQSVVDCLRSARHRICGDSRLPSCGRTITDSLALPSEPTPMRRGYGSGLAARSSARGGCSPIRKSRKATGQPGLRYKKVGD
jgi:hypothetical protein